MTSLDPVTMLVIMNGLKYVVTTVKFMGDIYMYQEVFIQPIAHKLIANSPMKNKNKRKVKYMGKIFKRVLSIMYDYQLDREARRETRKEQTVVQRFNVRRCHELREDKVKERDLYKIGYVKDHVCKQFFPPVDVLKMVADAIQKKMALEPLKYLADDKEAVTNLIMGDGDVELFTKYKELFYFVIVICPVTKVAFKSELEGDIYSPSQLLYLQDKAKALR